MRIPQLLEFTEHHRYYCYRDFALSTVDYRMLSLIYKPLVGAFAISLFEQLVMSVPDGQTGYSKLEPHRKLLLSLGLALNEKNRSYLLDQLSKLEAMNLLQSSRFVPDEQGDFIYEYELQKPLAPDEFFQNIHFTMLLRDKLGKYAVIELRQQLHSEAPKEVVNVPYDKEQLTTPFYDIFQLNATIVDEELEQALNEIAPTRMNRQAAPTVSAGYTLAEILLRFPRNSANRYYVEQLRNYAEQLAQVNYIAYKYELTINQVCHLLDEDGVFDVAGEMNIDELQKLAIQFYKQDQKHELDKATVMAKQAQVYYDETAAAESAEVDVDEQYYLPVPKQIAQDCDIQQYNALMRNEPYTKFLKRIFPGEVPEMLFKQFTVIDLQYKLSQPVINVLIHYVIGANDSSRITRGYIESVAANMLMKGIDTYESAILYVREQDMLDKQKQQKQQAATSPRTAANGRNSNYRSTTSKTWGQTKSKPYIPTVSRDQTASSPAMSEEQLNEIRKIAMKLDQNN